MSVWVEWLPSPSSALITGWVHKHKRGARSAKSTRRFAAYDAQAGRFSYFTDETMLEERGRAHVLYAIPVRAAAAPKGPAPGGGTAASASPAGKRGSMALGGAGARAGSGKNVLGNHGSPAAVAEFAFRSEDGRYFD